MLRKIDSNKNIDLTNIGQKFFYLGSFLLPSAFVLGAFTLLISLLISFFKNFNLFLKDRFNKIFLFATLLLLISSFVNQTTFNDNKNWHSGLIGKMFYHKCPDNDKYFRSIRVAHNPFTNSLQPQISNPIYGEPPEELKPISPVLLNRLMRTQMSSSFH